MTSPAAGLLGGQLRITAVGADMFADAMEEQGIQVERVSWRPPGTRAGRALSRLAPVASQVSQANDIAVTRLQQAHPLLVGVGVASDLIPEMDDTTFLHAGPPIEWRDMTGPLRGAILGAAMHEGLAADPEEAQRKAESGAFQFSPCHDHRSVGPMAGVVSASMPMWIVEDQASGNQAYCTMNEGLGRVLRYGAYDGKVLERLRWMGDVLFRVMGSLLAAISEPIDLRSLIAHAIQMGDEAHNRNRAATSLLIRELLPGFIQSGEPTSDLEAVASFITENDHFFLNLGMAAAKVTADAAAGIEMSSMVTAMSRNGTEFGVRLSGTGDEWFTGPSGMVDGLYFPGFGPEDANRDIGDSTITETIGIGGFAMAAAPAIVRYVGGSTSDAVRATKLMYEISVSESKSFLLPELGFRGTPLGIDAREVVHTGILPVVNTGIAHREAGVGQIGAGMVEPPMDAFVLAIERLAGTEV